MIDQPNRSSRNPGVACLRWIAYSIVCSILLACGCAANKGAHSAAKLEKKSADAKSHKDDEFEQADVDFKKSARSSRAIRTPEPSRFRDLFKKEDDNMDPFVSGG